jgi:phosphoribosyl-ATP pyrophosphohydrolase/phosphoribosyl-AMP cyclohydrolase
MPNYFDFKTNGVYSCTIAIIYYKILMETLNFSKSPDGLLPAIIQDATTQKVLMLGFMNEEAYQQTIATKKVTFFSRTKQRLWTKGETSGNFLEVIDIKIDCDQDTLLIQAKPLGVVCHTGADTCFNDTNKADSLQFLAHLEQIIQDYRTQPKEGSYTSSLFKKGINKVAQKVGEEAVELVIEAKDNNDDLFKNEAADLLYHYLVLLAAKGFSLADITEVLQQRHR